MKTIQRWLPIVGAGLLAIFVISLAAYVIFGLTLSANPETSRVAQVLTVLNNNWKALLILVLISFYRPIYAFLANLRIVTLPGGTKVERGEPSFQPPAPPPPAQLTSPMPLPQSDGGHQ